MIEAITSAQKKRTQENLIFNDFVPCWPQRSVPEVLHAKHSFEWKNARWQFFFSQQGGLSGMKLFGNCRVWNHLCQLLAWIFFPKVGGSAAAICQKKMDSKFSRQVNRRESWLLPLPRKIGRNWTKNAAKKIGMRNKNTTEFRNFGNDRTAESLDWF